MSDFKDFYTGNNYNQHMYNGLIGFMTLSHKRMEKNKKKKEY